MIKKTGLVFMVCLGLLFIDDEASAQSQEIDLRTEKIAKDTAWVQQLSIRSVRSTQNEYLVAQPAPFYGESTPDKTNIVLWGKRPPLWIN